MLSPRRSRSLSASSFHVYFPLIRKTTWYSSTYGCGRFFIIDSSVFSETGDFRPGSAQYSWIKKELNRNYPPLKIVLLHHPPFSSRKPSESSALVRKHLAPLFEKNGVAVVLAGHDHYYERSTKDGICSIPTAGGDKFNWSNIWLNSN